MFCFVVFLHRFAGGHHRHLCVHHIALQFGWYVARTCDRRSAELPMPYQRRSTTHTGEEVVHRAARHHVIRRSIAIRIHLHRSVSATHSLTQEAGVENANVVFFFVGSSYFVFTSFWAYKIYYVYGFMLLVFLILVVVTICVTIVTTYFLLNAEDYRWYVTIHYTSLTSKKTMLSLKKTKHFSNYSRQWTSFSTGASIAIYIYMYSFYYYFFKTK